MRAIQLALILGAAAGVAACAARPVRITSAPTERVPRERDPGPPADYSPRTAGVITLLNIELPAEGTTIGHHFAGVQYARIIGNMTMGGATRQRWTRTVRDTGDSVLVAQGFRVQIPGPPSSDAEQLRGVRFGLSGIVSRLDVKTVGYVEPFEIEASVRIDWELLDLSSGASVYEGASNGGAKGADSLEAAVNKAVANALGRLTGLPAFQRAIMAPRPLYAQDLLVADFVHRVPRDSEAVSLETAAMNMNAETGNLGGIVVLHGSRGFSASAVVLSKDGLALAPAEVARQRWVWSRNFDGRTRAARVLRASGDVALIELSCMEACETVMWERDTTLADRTRVVWIGAQGVMRNAAMGVVYAWKPLRVRRERDGTLTWRTRGKPVPLNGSGIAREDGVVVGIATRTGIVPLDRALTALNITVVP